MTIIPPSIVPDSLSLPTHVRALPSHCVLTGDLHSPADSPVHRLRFDRLPHGPASSSSPPNTAFSRVAPQVVSFSDPYDAPAA
ncbi:hypothetical protein BJV78DRAFT_1264126 [Lactifluus subvellereus]|nr:hypothetical protein BJV78DRAFT_1264126 [Lactifluus subvellereus]